MSSNQFKDSNKIENVNDSNESQQMNNNNNPNKKCTSCLVLREPSNFIVNDKTYKTCNKCREDAKQKREKNKKEIINKNSIQSNNVNKKTCKNCKKEQDIKEFLGKNKIKLNGHCKTCRDKTKKYKSENKEAVNKRELYARLNKEIKIKPILIRKYNSNDEYQKFYDLKPCSDSIEVKNSNLSRVLSGKAKQTGGYEGKYGDEETITNAVRYNRVEELEKLKKEIDKENSERKPIISSQRVLHTEKNGIKGKICCTCKNWVQLTGFFVAKEHWDGYRNDCKKCIYKYKNKKFKEDEQTRITANTRRQVHYVLNTSNDNNAPLKLIGCTREHFKKYIISLLKNKDDYKLIGGEIQLDHIIPCSAWDLTNEFELKACFHYTNYQPMYRIDNIKKGNKYNPDDKKKYLENYVKQINLNNINEIKNIKKDKWILSGYCSN